MATTLPIEMPSLGAAIGEYPTTHCIFRGTLFPREADSANMRALRFLAADDKAMARLNVIDRDGNEHQVVAQPGVSVMEVLRDQGDFGVAAICGGLCSCATCHVYVEPEWMAKLKARHNDEQEILVALSSFKDNSRLSCQIPFTNDLDGLKVTVAPEE